MKMIDIQASIEKKREELIELVRMHGFNHEKVVVCSQELDELVYRLMENITYQESMLSISAKKNTNNSIHSP
ncbi:Spo0E like sporulation regulatory protein [Bacillus sp. 491mf]|uniref:aspartyl-phosphate phosphatase Spo0E family protein n=1 Tax=Bacillus TaxID=1386 RepID=UPI0005593CE3|nr:MULTISPECIES: aspartyl-phosphate phosphatase Spo0E family protein [Bacillus]SFD58662.1 Spo0E like sporulation regulatory protein [Bacillus sp. 491mf]